MKYYATIKVEQTYEIEAESREQAEKYFRARWTNQDGTLSTDPDWNTLKIEEFE